MKLTEWYQSDQKPDYFGVFQRLQVEGGIVFSYFDGDRFGVGCGTEKAAHKLRGFYSDYQNLPWRGVEK